MGINTSRPLVFVFPYHCVGGVSLLFLRLAQHFADELEQDVYVVDYKDGYIAKNITSPLVRLIEYVDDGQVCLPKNSSLIFQAMTPWSIFKSLIFDKSQKFIFWNCHPYNLIPVMPGIRNFLFKHTFLLDLVNTTFLYGFKIKAKKFLLLLLEKKAIVFMDEVNVGVTSKHLDIDIQVPNYLPIPAPDTDTEHTYTVKNSKLLSTLHVCWVGRIVDFKYYILWRAIERLSNAQHKLNIPVEITVIGDGDFKADLIDKTSSFNNIKISYVDYMSPVQLDNFLAEEVDVLMAMGTSALEGAKLQIPTILLDFSYSKVASNYRFRWLQQQIGYSLGAPITKKFLADNDQTLLTLLSSVITNKQMIGSDCYTYYKNNHTLTAVASELLKYIERSNCYYVDIASRSLLDRGYLYTFFSKLRRLVI